MSNEDGGNLRDIKVEGINTFDGGEFNRVQVEGVINLKNDLTAKFISIEGVFNAQGKIISEELYCEGVAKVDGLIRAKNAHIEGTIKLKGDRFEADSIDCTGILTVEGEINADKIIAEGIINANEIYGDYVEINSVVKNMFGFFDGFFSGYRCSKVGLIEATTVSIHGVKGDTVNGHNVTIGKGCKIKNVCCDGTLDIHPSAIVENITGTYTTSNNNR